MMTDAVLDVHQGTDTENHYSPKPSDYDSQIALGILEAKSSDSLDVHTERVELSQILNIHRFDKKHG